MRPTLLKAGDKVMYEGREMTFLRREKPSCGRPALNWFNCGAFKGQDGPNDNGDCHMTDYRVSRKVERAHTLPSPQGLVAPRDSGDGLQTSPVSESLDLLRRLRALPTPEDEMSRRNVIYLEALVLRDLQLDVGPGCDMEPKEAA